MSYSTTKLKDISIIRTGKLDSNAAVENGIYPFFTCDPQTLSINTWAYDTEAVLLAGNNASGNYTAKYYEGKFNAYQRTYIIESFDKRVPFADYCREYVLQSILYTMDEFQNLTTGSTMKHIQRGKLKEVFINVPESTLMNQYGSLAEPIRQKILVLKKQNQSLTETRDRLLPKLMSGELEV